MEDKIIYEDRIVAYLDILGFKHLVNKSIDSEAVAEEICYILKFIKLEQEINDKHPEHNTLDRQVSVFSDSIVISYPVGFKSTLKLLLLDITYLQCELIRNGILIRGGISIGKLYHKMGIVFGPALVEAYKLESEQAKYSRVLLEWDKNNIPKIVASKEELEEICIFLKQDEKDEYIYVNSLNPETFEQYNSEPKVLYKFRNRIIDELQKNSPRSPGFSRLSLDNRKKKKHIFEKWKWLLYEWNKGLLSYRKYMLEEYGACNLDIKTLKIKTRYPYA